MFNTAFCPDSNHLAEEMHGPTVNWMRKIAKKKKCAITGTLMIKENGNIYNIQDVREQYLQSNITPSRKFLLI